MIDVETEIMKPFADNMETISGNTVLYANKGKPEIRPDMPYSSVELINLTPANPLQPYTSNVDNTTDEITIKILMEISIRIQTYGKNALGILSEFNLLQSTFDWSPLTVRNVRNAQQASVQLNNTNEERAFLNIEATTNFVAKVISDYFNSFESVLNMIMDGNDDTNIFKSVNLEGNTL